MSKVFFDLGITLDGYIARPNGGANNPLGDDGLNIHNWMFKQKAFLSHLKLEGGEANNKEKFSVEISEVVNSTEVTHLKYNIVYK